MGEDRLITPLASSVHYVLRYISTGMISASLLVTLLCIFIIIRVSPKTSAHYARLLLLVTILPLTSDISFHFILDPVPLFPLPCLFRWQPILDIPGTATAYYAIWVTTLVWNGCAYGACFLFRHQAVIPPGFPGKISYRTRVIIISTTVLITSMCGPVLVAARLPDDKTIPLLNQTVGFTEAELKRVDCYEMSMLYVYIGCCFVCFAIAIVVLVLLTFHIRVLLKDAVRISMSEKTREFHRIMTRALATQATVAFTFLIAPLVTCFTIFLTRVDISILYPLTFISAHSFTHSAVVMVTTPLYRRAIKDLLFRGFFKTILVTPRERKESSLHHNSTTAKNLRNRTNSEHQSGDM